MIYQFFKFLTDPFVASQLLMGGILAALWYRRPLSRRWLITLTIPWALLYVFSLPVTGHLLLGSLEWSYPPQVDWPADSQAIVVLSGGYAPPDAVRRDMQPSSSTLYRLLTARNVYKVHGPCPIIVSGGKFDPSRYPDPDSQRMQDLLVELGVPAKDIVQESESRSTYENAVHVAQLLKARGLDRAILVTDAFHMRRSVLCFEKQGIQLDPAPCNHLATEWTLPFIYWFLPDRSAATSSQTALNEWIGQLWYWLHGRI